jgi:hypothetical protein
VTVVARTFVSVPVRSATHTWQCIVALVAPDPKSPARRELAAVAGVACSCIADEALVEALVVHGVGPRLRVYALYGDDAVEGENANESALSWVPTDGDWRMSLPCLSDDLAWVQGKLAKASARVTARALGAVVDGEDDGDERAPAWDCGEPVVDLDAFFRR